MKRVKYLLYPIKNAIQKWMFSYKWRCINSENDTVAKTIFPVDIVNVGKRTYGELNILSYHSENEGLYIGNYCSIANDVLFVLGGEHNYKCFSNFPFCRRVFRSGIDAISKGKIIVEDDVWIGARCTILSGVKLGKGCVIGAGSVVVKDVPPYAIFANGRIIKYRFSDEVINKLNSIDFSTLNEAKLLRNQNILHNEIDEYNIDQVLRQIV